MIPGETFYVYTVEDEPTVWLRWRAEVHVAGQIVSTARGTTSAHAAARALGHLHWARKAKAAEDAPPRENA